MFQKPAFGANTSFGASTSSPFGGFKSTTGTSAFGAAPAFGAGATSQPTAGGGLFGATNTTGGLFGNTSTTAPTSAFGSNTTGGFGFGQPSTSSGLFGTTTGSGGLFGATQQNTTNTFGAKPAGFGFSNTPTAGTTGSGLFGAPAQNTSGLFATQNTSIGGGGLFGGTTSAFGQPQANGTALVKYNPVAGTDVMMKSGASTNINIKHHCITCMKEYENKSLEELRLEDYVAGRKGATNTGLFGGFQTQTENKPLFGGSSFGQPAATSASNMFTGGTSTFGQSNSFSFGQTAQAPATSNLFGAAKPAFGATSTPGTGLFGTSTTQSAPAFGATNAFGFGSNTQTQTNLFGAKPATSAFGTTPATGTTGFGAFGANTAGSTLFGAKPVTSQANTFGAPNTGFGIGGFGTTTSTSGGLFGANNAFAAKPAAPTFGFGTNTNTGGFGTTGALNTFQKPTGTLFPTTFSTANTSMFNTTQNTQPLNFGTGATGLGSGGLNFGTSTLGGSSLGGLGGFGATTNTTLNASNLAGSAASGNVHEQIMTLAARPYGDSPLFKDLLPDSTTKTENMLKPTNPAAVKAVLDSSGYKVGSPETRIKVQPRTTDQNDKKSLFDGLEESDASLEGKLTLKPSRKRLVLRPHNRVNHVDERPTESNRSLEEQVLSPLNGIEPVSSTLASNDSAKRQVNSTEGPIQRSFDDNVRGVNTDLESSSEKHSSWLGSSRLDSPRLYPDLDNNAFAVDGLSSAERRASWLTTKPLRKQPLSVNRDSVENSVRELRADVNSNDKDNEDLSVSEEENIAPVESTPHPSGVKLTRPGYYTIPSLDEMLRYKSVDGSIVVPQLTVGRKNYGNVTFDGEVDVAGLDLDELVQFLNKEIIVYPDDSVKPPVGQGLNRKATVTLDRVWPRDKTEKKNITDPERLLKMDYEGKLRRICDKHDTKFVEYRPETGSWVFRVKHFSKYGLTDSDEDEEHIGVVQPQLANQALQKAAPIPPTAVPVIQATSGPGLGGLTSLVSKDNSLLAMQQTSLNLLNGNSKTYDMDVTDDAITEQSTLYPEVSRAFGVKSPTGELARLEHRSSRHVQLMKASLYTDTEMDDDVSMSTGDQRVPSPKSSITERVFLTTPTILGGDITEETASEIQTEEIQMRPLIVRPHTNILRYHRKIPPLKQTIAGRLDASCIADLAVSHARLSRVGFGPRRNVVYVTTHNTITDLSSTSDLGDLEKYVRGRHGEDWSESVVARVSLARYDKIGKMHELLTSMSRALLDHSSYLGGDEGNAPRLIVTDDPMRRLDLLKLYINGSKLCAKKNVGLFTVSGNYCLEIWKLCEALWEGDLKNKGVPGMDEKAIVDRHNSLIEWLTSAVSRNTDKDLAKPSRAEDEDPCDLHSRSVWLLLLGGRILEACKTAKANGDLNMAMLIAQAASDESFRTLLAHQLRLWSESGAETLISRYKIYAIRLLAGESCPGDGLASCDWLRAFNATARYLTPQVPSLDRIVTKYESFFHDVNSMEDQMDLSFVDKEAETGMEYPVPDYCVYCQAVIEHRNTRKRILDLRYELIRARATDSRPKLNPESYTADPLDYSLSFLLGSWFGSPMEQSITGMADQLEAHGFWDLAVQIVMFHPNTRIRNNCIRKILSRNVPSQISTAVEQKQIKLLEELRVPKNWILMAQAHRAKYEKLPAVEVEHLVGACQWNAAHRVLVNELMPRAVLSNKFDGLLNILEKMNEAAGRNEVSGWDRGGQAYYHYIHLRDEVCNIVSPDTSRVSLAVESLWPRLFAVCGALGASSSASTMQRAARAHVSTAIIQLATAANATSGQLAALLKALRLPPDCRVPTQQKITNDLAACASEYYTDSTNSSPLSSLNRNLGSAKN